MEEAETFGVGMVGYGWIGKVHAHAHLSLPLMYDPLPAQTRLVGVCTATPESGEKARQTAGFIFAVSDYRALLSRDDIQIIHICTPNDVHAEVVLAALDAGKHIYCEKPLGVSVSEAKAVCERAQNVETVQQMTFNYRFVPAILRARQLVEDGFLGDLFQFRAAYLHAGYVDPKRPFSWRMSRVQSGGGAIADLGAHVIDLVRFLVGPGTCVAGGGEFEAVQADLQIRVPQRPDPRTGEMRTVEVDDMALALCQLEGGATGTLEATRLATGVQDELRIELHGSRGGLRFNLMDPNWLDAYDATKPEGAYGGDRGYTRIEAATRYPKPYAFGGVKNTAGWQSFHIASIFDFVSNVARYENGEAMSPIAPTFADGLAAQRVIAACQLSSAQDGRRIRLSEMGVTSLVESVVPE